MCHTHRTKRTELNWFQHELTCRANACICAPLNFIKLGELLIMLYAYNELSKYTHTCAHNDIYILGRPSNWHYARFTLTPTITVDANRYDMTHWHYRTQQSFILYFALRFISFDKSKRILTLAWLWFYDAFCQRSVWVSWEDDHFCLFEIVWNMLEFRIFFP